MWGFRFGQVETRREWVEEEGLVGWKDEVVRRPLVTEWSEKLLATCREDFLPQALGYRMVRREAFQLTSIWARPLVVWFYLVGCEWAARRVWFARWWVTRGVRQAKWWKARGLRWLVPGKDLEA